MRLNFKLAFLLPIVALAAALLPQAALADTIATLSLNPSTQTVTTTGGTVTFYGTISAPSSNTGNVYLNGAELAFNGPGSGDINPFFNNTPAFLAPGTNTNVNGSAVALFAITFNSGATMGKYFGTFSVFGGANDTALNTLDSQRFEVDIVAPTAVSPEPSSLVLLGTGVLGAVGAMRRRLCA